MTACAEPVRLWIAGSAFEIRANGSAGPLQLGPAFDPFRQAPGGSVRGVCRIEVRSAVPEGGALEGGQRRWSFVSRAGRTTLTRWMPGGEAVWQAQADEAFTEVTLALHPMLAARVFGDLPNAWQAGLGVTMLVFHLLPRNGLVLHGCAAVIGGDTAVVGAGRSGSGKSTLARLIEDGGGAVLSDERPAVRRSADGEAFEVFGTPWPSSAGLARNRGGRLRRLYFLEHGPEDAIEALPPSRAVRRLIGVTAIPWQDARFFDPALATAAALLEQVPCAVLRFRPGPGAVAAILRDLALGRPADGGQAG